MGGSAAARALTLALYRVRSRAVPLALRAAHSLVEFPALLGMTLCAVLLLLAPASSSHQAPMLLLLGAHPGNGQPAVATVSVSPPASVAQSVTPSVSVTPSMSVSPSASVSTSVSMDPSASAPTISLTDSPVGPVVANSTVTIIARMTPASAFGAVRFYVNGTLLGVDTPYRIEASWVTAPLSPGTYHLTADFTTTGVAAPVTSNVVVLVVTGVPTRTLTPSVSASSSDSQPISVVVASPSASVLATATSRALTPSPSATQSTAVLGEQLQAGHGGGLPFTGLDVVGLAAAAVAAVGGGGALLVMSRRVRKRRP